MQGLVTYKTFAVTRRYSTILSLNSKKLRALGGFSPQLKHFDKFSTLSPKLVEFRLEVVAVQNDLPHVTALLRISTRRRPAGEHLEGTRTTAVPSEPNLQLGAVRSCSSGVWRATGSRRIAGTRTARGGRQKWVTTPGRDAFGEHGGRIYGRHRRRFPLFFSRDISPSLRPKLHERDAVQVPNVSRRNFKSNSSKLGDNSFCWRERTAHKSAQLTSRSIHSLIWRKWDLYSFRCESWDVDK